MKTTRTTPATTAKTTPQRPLLSKNHANHASARVIYAHMRTRTHTLAHACLSFRGYRGLSGLLGFSRGFSRGLQFSRVVLLTGGEKWMKSTVLKSANSRSVTGPFWLPASRLLPANLVNATFAANGQAAWLMGCARHAETNTTCHDLPALHAGDHRNWKRGRGHGSDGIPKLQCRRQPAGARAVRARNHGLPVAGTV